MKTRSKVKMKFKLAKLNPKGILPVTLLIMGFLAGLAVFFSPLKANSEESQIYIKIGEAHSKKSLIAIPPIQYFGAPTPSSKFQQIGTELFNVINNDLAVSSYFQMIPHDGFLEDTSKVGLKPLPEANGFKFANWTAIKAEFLIRAGFSIIGKELTLEAYLYHVPKGTLILGRKYVSKTGTARKIAHTFCNDLLKSLTGKEGMFLSKIVATSDRNGGDFREVYTMDWDSANLEKITNHKTIALSPSWSSDGRFIAYTAFVQQAKTKMRNANVFLYDSKIGSSKLISSRQGINSGATFTPDNKYILLTLSEGGSPDIFKIDLDGGLSKRLTHGPNAAINVEPNVNWVGDKIAFSSDRHGRPMIYTMNLDGSSVDRITFAGVFNSTPAWSPDGKKIAFAGQEDDHFDIFVVDADKTNMIRVTSARKTNGKWSNNEDPSFSPDGRFLMYTSNRSGKNQIYISTVDGSEERQITDDNFNYYKPKWSHNFE